MFAYCNNNPVSMVDDTGSNPVTLWYYLFLYSDFGYIHRRVQDHIKTHNLGQQIRTEVWVTKENGSLGRIDIMNNKQQIWEVKYYKSQAEASTQVNSYLKSTILSSGELLTELGPCGAFSGTFIINYLGVSYQVEYWTPQPGVVVYNLTTLEQYDPNPAYVYKPHPKQQQNRQRALALGYAMGMGAFVLSGLYYLNSHSLNLAYS